MAIDFVPEWDTLMSCPYDKTHRVRAARFTRHIIKCSRSYPKLSICPFNALHRFPDIERAAHIATCVDKVVVERELIRDADPAMFGSGNVESPAFDSHIPSTEDWDLESESSPCGAYDPTEAMNRARVRNPATLSNLKPSEKRLFHKQLLIRSREASRANSVSSVSDKTIDDYLADEMSSLRLPKNPSTLSPFTLPKQPFVLGREWVPISRSASSASTPSSVSIFDRTQSVISSAASEFKGFGRGRRLDNAACSTSNMTQMSQHSTRTLNTENESNADESYKHSTDSDCGSFYSVPSATATPSGGSAKIDVKDWRHPKRPSSPCQATSPDNSTSQIDHVRHRLAGLRLEKSTTDCDSIMLKHIIDRLSDISLNNPSGSYNSDQVQYIIEDLSRVSINRESSQHDPNLIHYIVDQLINIHL